MNNSIKIYIALLLLLLVGSIAYDSSQPKPVNWTPTYSVTDKIPFGLYVFDHEIENTLPQCKVEKHYKTAYEYLDSEYDADTLVKDYKVRGTVFNVSELSSIDEESIREICYFVGHGNNAFLSAKVLPKELLDSLDVKMGSEFESSDSIFNWIANPKLGRKKYNILEGVGTNYFSKVDTLKTTVLGYQGSDSTHVNFIKVQFHKGAFYLHTQPAAFTNFHLLKGDHAEYAQQVLSYVPKGKVFWFLKGQDGSAISSSPLHYILSQPALEWAWYLFLIGMFVFMVFNAKRKQRVVPIITPLSNTTIDFAKSIGNLYYQEGDHDNIINKKIIYFLEKIRNEYLIDTQKLDDEFVKKLHQKSGKDLNDIKKAVFLINAHRKSPHNAVEEDLIQIDNAIEKIM